MSTPIRIALVGMGKIARDQHLPAISASAAFRLAATVSREHHGAVDAPAFRSLDELSDSGVEVDAVAVCTPPQVRRSLAAFAIKRGWHVFLEKPPTSTISEVEALRDMAGERRVSLFASWHSRYAEGVETARSWLAGKRIHEVAITWREDVRVWHPGQEWIWQPGGFGVFDPGINALSIATRILPHPFFVEAAQLEVPSNRFAPIGARVNFRDTAGVQIMMDLDWRQQGAQQWDIEIATDDGRLVLSNGGSSVAIGGERLPGYDEQGILGEYPALYRRFAQIIECEASDVDISPLRLVADVFLSASTSIVDPFYD